MDNSKDMPDLFSGHNCIECDKVEGCILKPLIEFAREHDAILLIDKDSSSKKLIEWLKVLLPSSPALYLQTALDDVARQTLLDLLNIIYLQGIMDGWLKLQELHKLDTMTKP